MKTNPYHIMKRLLSLIILLACFMAKAQSDSVKQYVVNYKLEYDAIYAEDSTKNHKAIYYINSKENNFFATVRPDESGKLKLHFTDFNGKNFSGNLSTEEVKAIENTGIAQKTFFELENPYKYQINNYEYFAQKDSLINGYNCAAYLLKSTKPKREKRKKLIHEKYYLDTSKPMLPMLIEVTAYEIWKARKTAASGLLVQKDAFKTDGKLFYTEKLTAVTPVNFTISLIGDVTTAYRIDIH